MLSCLFRRQQDDEARAAEYAAVQGVGKRRMGGGRAPAAGQLDMSALDDDEEPLAGQGGGGGRGGYRGSGRGGGRGGRGSGRGGRGGT